jgi:hypothetical protein
MASPFRRHLVHRWAAIGVVALMAAPIAPPLRAASVVTSATPPQYALKTRANTQAIEPLARAFFAYDDYLKQNKGKAPVDAAARLDEMTRLSVQAKADIHAFVAALRPANETDAFEKAVYASAETSARPTLASEIRAQGGPIAVLGQADRLLDALIAERRHGAGGRGSLDAMLELVGLTTALHASVLSTACGFFWFTITLGYGTTHAYYSCYDGTL